MQQSYDGDGLRAKKIDNGTTTYYLRSSVLGGQVVAEVSSGGAFQRGYVYLGGQLLAVQQANAVSWVHQDPVAKSKRVTNSAGTVVSTVELDPWGGNTNRSNNDAFQPRKFTTYERDGNASDEAMHRRYNRWWSRFDQPDPYDGSYNLGDPQSFNRYAYVQNDPINFTDPTGLEECGRGDWCIIVPGGIFGGGGGILGGGGIDEFEVGIGDVNLGGSPQDPVELQEPNDCIIFAGVVDVLAQEASSDSAFITNLFNRFKDRNDSSFLARGFRPQFVDTGSSPNQVRHSAGAITAGYLGGFAAISGGRATYALALKSTLAAFNERERAFNSYTVTGAIAPGVPSTGHTRAPSRDQVADIQLNGVAVPIGFRLGVGHIGRGEVGNLIREAICNPTP